MSEGVPLIKVQNVFWQAGGRQVLEDISFELTPQRITILLGPNGAGKTTLLKIMLGILSPARGVVYRKTGLRVGYMPQKIHLDLLMPLTVQRFLELTRFCYLSPLESLKKVGASHILSADLRTLSGGELQKVGLARALIQKPHLLILDEPTQALDVQGQAMFYELIEYLRDTMHCAVFLVSHDLHVVMRSSDQVLCLNGHICCRGHPTTIKNHRAYHDLFPHQLSTAHLAPYTHRHDHSHRIF